MEFDVRIIKNHKHVIIQRLNYENYEIQRIAHQNHENHENLIIQRKNNENHEIHRIPCHNHENHENLIIQT